MAARPSATTARCLCVMLVKACVIVVVALCSGFRHLKLMRTVLTVLRNLHCVVENDVLCAVQVK